jgi:hypothetical protein
VAPGRDTTHPVASSVTASVRAALIVAMRARG